LVARRRRMNRNWVPGAWKWFLWLFGRREIDGFLRRKLCPFKTSKVILFEIVV